MGSPTKQKKTQKNKERKSFGEFEEVGELQKGK